MPKLLVLGDDLTGSNATGARYAHCLRAESGIDALVVNLVPATPRHHTPRRRCGP